MRTTRPTQVPAARWWRGSVVVVFALQFVVLGLWLEGLRGQGSGVLLSALQSVLLWSLLALPALHSRLWRGALAMLVAPIMVLQALFHARYGTFIDAEVIRSTIRFWADVKPELAAFAPKIGLLTLCVAVAEFAWLSLACRRASGSP